MEDLRGILLYLYDFYIVAKENGFTKAAIENYMSQPTLSRNIKSLEESLNLLLLYRNSKGNALTCVGEDLYKGLDEAFIQLLETLNNISASSKEMVGKITIGITRNIADNFFIKYLLKFNEEYPNVKIKLLIDSPTNLNSYLITHKIDFLIDYLPHVDFNEKLDLSINTIGYFNTCFACSKKLYSKIGTKVKKIEDLKTYNLIIPSASRRRQYLDEVLQKNNIELVPKIEMPDSKLMMDFVKNSDYIGYFIKEEINDADIIPLEIEGVPTNSIGLIYPKSISNVAKSFVNLILAYDDLFKNE